MYVIPLMHGLLTTADFITLALPYTRSQFLAELARWHGEGAIFVTFFLAMMVASRAYSIYYCLWMERALSTTIIEYPFATEPRAINAILGGMPRVLVDNVTEGTKYGAGYRLDQSPDYASHPLLRGTQPDPRMFGRVVGGTDTGATRVSQTGRGPTIGRDPYAMIRGKSCNQTSDRTVADCRS